MKASMTATDFFLLIKHALSVLPTVDPGLEQEAHAHV